MKYLMFFLLVIGFGFVMFYGLDKQARVDCLKWKSQEADFPAFYSTDWQKAQCEQFDITFSR